MPSTIRLASPGDAEQVLAIYRPFCTDSIVSFELEPPSLDEMCGRIATTMETLPWLVCEKAGEIRGYVYASRHRARAAYQWSVDVTAYVREGYRRMGIGRGLYTSLFKVLTMQGYFNAYAGIALPNSGSVALHESVGFQSVGIYRNVGYKLGAWRDVGWWQLALQPHSASPPFPVALPAIRESSELSDCLQAGEPWINDAATF
jgi:L-amino acid N-acyltransferase YncA